MKLLTYLKLQNLFILIFILGIASNSIAVLHNDCKMPFYAPYEYLSGSHVSFYEKGEINFYYLADIFKIRNIYFSFGDLCLTIGGIGLIWMLIYQFKQYRRIKKGGRWKD